MAARPGAAGAEAVRFERRVSWRPGAEGAPRVGWGPEGVEVVVLVVWVAWFARGAMRRDCEVVRWAAFGVYRRVLSWGGGDWEGRVHVP